MTNHTSIGSFDRRTILTGAALALPASAGLLASSVAHAGGSWVVDTLRIGTFSGDISTLAVEKLTNPAALEFAKVELEEAKAVGGLLLGAGYTPPPRPENLKKLQAELEAMEAGVEYDRKYLAVELQGHETLRPTQAAEIAHGRPGEDKTIATVLLPLVNSHIAMIKYTQGIVASG